MRMGALYCWVSVYFKLLHGESYCILFKKNYNHDDEVD